VLPFVLSGLALLLVESAAGITNIGAYIRDELPKRLPMGRGRSWEQFIEDTRREESRRVFAAASPALILIVPSIASLVITRDQATSDLLPLFWGGVIALAVVLLASWRIVRAGPPAVS
jgi:hypothetical protein